MGESVDYWGQIKCKDKEEAKEVEKCINGIEGLGWEVFRYGDTVEFLESNGWRGGGASCKELLDEWFKPLTEKFPHLGFDVQCTYNDQAPTYPVRVGVSE